MKIAWLGLGTLMLAAGCGGDGGAQQPPNTAGTSNGGSSGAGTTGGGGSGGSGTSGSATTGGGGSGTAGSTTTGGGGSGTGGSGGSGTAGNGGSGGSGTAGFTCPAGPFDAPAFGTPVRVEGVPPSDAFNNMNNDFTNIEGAVWVGDALYVSEIATGATPPSRILKITADGQVSIAVPNSGTNGLAVNAAGELFGAKHSDGSVSKIALPGGTATVIAGMFMGARFDSPNDLAIHSNGTIYFSDPDWQAATPRPQAQTRAYIVKPGGMPEAIPGNWSQPNGVTLSKNQDFLYIGGNQLRKFPVMADGSLGTGTDFVQGGTSDGMVIDCADNLYTTNNGIVVYDKDGKKLGNTIMVNGLGQVTNVAFGGADHKTLYVTGQGSGNQKGLFKIPMNVPGFPY